MARSAWRCLESSAGSPLGGRALPLPVLLGVGLLATSVLCRCTSLSGSTRLPRCRILIPIWRRIMHVFSHKLRGVEQTHVWRQQVYLFDFLFSVDEQSNHTSRITSGARQGNPTVYFSIAMVPQFTASEHLNDPGHLFRRISTSQRLASFILWSSTRDLYLRKSMCHGHEPV